MRVLLCGIALSALASCASPGERIGVSMAQFDDNFLTVLRNGMQDYAQTLDGVNLQVEDAQNDVAQAAEPDPELHRRRASTRSSSTRSIPTRPRP